ncbi:hypothetical protein VKT23_003655 [Stygiomarasmius scandens]|uniref:Uncharacterized protein n=1 Tax=Marasmiellus scandens TaxID=2682957 RepID=A0ABR1JYL6_9AGAR
MIMSAAAHVHHPSLLCLHLVPLLLNSLITDSPPPSSLLFLWHDSHFSSSLASHVAISPAPLPSSCPSNPFIPGLGPSLSLNLSSLCYLNLLSYMFSHSLS